MPPTVGAIRLHLTCRHLGTQPYSRAWTWTTKVNKTDSCWIWTGTVFPKSGYGRFNSPTANSSCYPHRIAYEDLVGPIPEDLTIDHLCRNKLCVNPDHLEAVTIRENIQRAWVYRRKAS